jgi:hypothetical protein
MYTRVLKYIREGLKGMGGLSEILVHRQALIN